jgi:predicted O-methyltransferase YrrM
MVFVDSSKGHYIEMYDDMKRLLKAGGLLVCDDVIFYGKINDDPKEAPHKHRTIVGRLRTFLDRISADNDFVTSLIDTGDGMAIAVKKG